jgi:hypothetical protein
MENKIYKLSDEDYAAIATEVEARLTTPCYFTGVIEVPGRDDTTLRFTASLILYRHRPDIRSNYEKYDAIYDVSPVWWDFVCEGEEGIIWDDFDFERFTQFLID